MKRYLKRVAYNLPITGAYLEGKQRIYDEYIELKKENTLLARQVKNLEPYKTWALPGHFDSPIPDIADVKKRATVIFNRNQKKVTGVNLNTSYQLKLVEEFGQYNAQIPFRSTKNEALRYYYRNGWFSYGDAITLYSFIRHYKPKRIIEVGSGFSSAAILDINDKFFDGRIRCTFIEPYPRRLKSLLKKSDKSVTIIEKRAELVELSVFDQLEKNDILFIDSSHVSKTGSDINRLVFDVLPRLKKGVLIHFHDIFYPFEYPETFVLQGRAWNEDYLIRALLMYNEHFKIEFYSAYLGQFYKDILKESMPEFMKLPGGSLWLRRQ